MSMHRWIMGAAFAALALVTGGARANHLVVTNVTLGARDSSTAFVRFDISWENSWRVAGTNGDALYFHDAAWVFFKVQQDGQTAWLPVTLEGAGVNPTGYSSGSGTAVELAVPADRAGLIVRRANDGAGTTAVQNVTAVWNIASNGLTVNSNVKLQALGVEMVYVPTGGFYVGDGTSANITGQFEAGTSGQPFAITNSGYAITLGGGGADSLGNHNASGMAGADDFNNTISKILPAAFPNGYAAFYCMKYEITQGQYADFLNSLTRAQQIIRANATTNLNYYMSNTSGGSATLQNRCTIQLLGDAGGNAPLVYAAAAPDRVCNYLRCSEWAAFLDWAGLRPLTELEFEKACRGPLTPVANEYAWGDTTLIKCGTLIGTDGSGTESYPAGNAHISGNGGPGGPVRAGIFATNNTTRAASGASYWGIMELSGDMYEWVVTVSSASPGRSFTGVSGDGALAANGDANVPNWPNATAGSFGGAGQRGGNYTDGTIAHNRVSDRYVVKPPSAGYSNGGGGRGGRTAP